MKLTRIWEAELFAESVLGETAEELSPDEFLKCVPEDDIVDEIFEALESFRQDEECANEYEYYDATLHVGTVTQ